jgi:hypothetical protein
MIFGRSYGNWTLRSKWGRISMRMEIDSENEDINFLYYLGRQFRKQDGVCTVVRCTAGRCVI